MKRQALGKGLDVLLPQNPIPAAALIELDLDGAHITRQVMPARSYFAQVELPVTIGLGQSDRINKLRITWPGGKQQTVADPPVGRLVTVEQ